MLKSSKLLVVIAALALCAAAMAQAPVPLDIVGPPVGGAQGTNEVGIGDPANGHYDVLINGYIGAYARVSAYDNWIDFGVMDPMMGTFATPVARLAWVNGAGGLETGEIGGRAPLYEVNGSTLNYDLAGLQIQTNARLDLRMAMGGYMTRVNETGGDWFGTDNRRADFGPYQLRNQVKMVLHGRFLDTWNGPNPDPDADEDGDQYASPTSGQVTDFATWTDWDPATNAINNDTGWFEPALVGGDFYNCPWSGNATVIYDGGRPEIEELDLIVERGQAQATGFSPAAEIWFTQRILRRGLQDVQGNYRSDMNIYLTYREGDVDDRWLPAEK